MASIKELQEQKDKNSAAWHNATTQAEKDRLHQENIKLQNQIDSMTGGSSSFNSSTGKWTTSTPASGSSGSSSNRPSSGVSYGTSSTGTGSASLASQKNNAWVSGVDDRGETDYSVLLQQAMQQGASAQVVQNLLDQRTQKAQQNGYTQYMYDDVYGAAMDYIRNAEAEVPYSPNYMGAITDNSDYLNQMYEAQKRAALAQINNAYQQNVNAINRAGEGVDTRYQNARNQAAGASELAARNFNEYAAASGLNSGAGGQAELARNVALQNSLGDIDTAEAQTYADLELQLANAETEYNNAIAEAEANGDAALAAALYQEKVRVQEATLQAMMQQYQDNLLANQTKHQWQQDAESAQLANRQQLAQYGTAWLENGVMPSQEMLDAMGITQQDAQAFLNQLSLQASLAAQRQQSSGNGGSGRSGGYKPVLTYSQVMDAIDRGNPKPQVLKDYQYYMGAEYEPEEDETPDGYTPSEAVQRQIKSLESMRGQSGSETAIANSIVALGTMGKITMDDAEYMLRYFGYNPRDYIEYD